MAEHGGEERERCRYCECSHEAHPNDGPCTACTCEGWDTNQMEAGEWVQPITEGYRMACCDCGLVHLMDFRIHEGKIQFRAFRAESHPLPDATPDGQNWQHAFKNFHRNICERVGYVHDAVDWYRDLASLEEYIAAELKRLPDATKDHQPICKCEHDRTYHSLYQGVQGDGSCCALGCDCKMFQLPWNQPLPLPAPVELDRKLSGILWKSGIPNSNLHNWGVREAHRIGAVAAPVEPAQTFEDWRDANFIVDISDFENHVGKLAWNASRQVAAPVEEGQDDDDFTDEVCPHCGEEGVPYGAYCHNTEKAWTDPVEEVRLSSPIEEAGTRPEKETCTLHGKVDCAHCEMIAKHMKSERSGE